jgi:hypothetical protein
VVLGDAGSSSPSEQLVVPGAVLPVSRPELTSISVQTNAFFRSREIHSVSFDDQIGAQIVSVSMSRRLPRVRTSITETASPCPPGSTVAS